MVEIHRTTEEQVAAQLRLQQENQERFQRFAVLSVIITAGGFSSGIVAVLILEPQEPGLVMWGIVVLMCILFAVAGLGNKWPEPKCPVCGFSWAVDVRTSFGMSPLEWRHCPGCGLAIRTGGEARKKHK